jgi:hypothetical protein
MSLSGKRVLVLQSEYLVALDVQALLEKHGAITAIEEPLDAQPRFDAVIVDADWAGHRITARLFAAGTEVIGYTGDRQRVTRIFPSALIINKPATQAEMLPAIEKYLDSVAPSTLGAEAVAQRL